MERIKEINKHITEAVDQWADVTLQADADSWSYHLNYTDEDVMNATVIFNHIVSNVGIKRGLIDETKATEIGERIHTLIKDATGVDSKEFYK